MPSSRQGLSAAYTARVPTQKVFSIAEEKCRLVMLYHSILILGLHSYTVPVWPLSNACDTRKSRGHGQGGRLAVVLHVTLTLFVTRPGRVTAILRGRPRNRRDTRKRGPSFHPEGGRRNGDRAMQTADAAPRGGFQHRRGRLEKSFC